MALVSPGVEVTIIDQSQYLPAGSNSVPMLLVATAQNKANASGTGVAVATTAANANKLYRVTSQRDLVTLYGNPFFYKTTNGTPIQGYELNEYGLMTAYSVLGATNLCYVLRADIDLASLVGQIGRPAGNPADGTFWLDTTNSTWGMFQFNQSTLDFDVQTPIVIDSSADTVNSSQEPQSYIGNIGDYAVVTGVTDYGDPDMFHTYWYKAGQFLSTGDSLYNSWVAVGSQDWLSSVPILQGSAVTPGTSYNLTISVTRGAKTFTETFASGIDASTLAAAINAIPDVPLLKAVVVNNRVNIFQRSLYDSTITLSDGASGTHWAQFGFQVGTYNAPTVFYGTNAQQPNWRASATARPTGSLWIKTNSANLGTNLVTSRYVAATDTFVSLACPLYLDDASASADLDSAGGKNIAVNTLYAQYSFGATDNAAPIQLFRRSATGASTFTGTNTSPNFSTGASTFGVYVSMPGSSSLSPRYVVSLPATVAAKGASDFVAAWSAANIPYTTASVSGTGAIVLTHTEGGQILLDDNAYSNSAIDIAGLSLSATTGAPTGSKPGPMSQVTLQTSGPTAGTFTVTGGTGTGATVTGIVYTGYTISSISVSGGTGYVTGDIVTLGGSSLTPYVTSTITAYVTAAGGAIVSLLPYGGQMTPSYMTALSNWQEFSYESNDIRPVTLPTNNTNWYYSVVDEVDIMVNTGTQWVGYRNATYGTNGLWSTTATGTTDPAGPIISASEPTVQSDGTPLVYGDIWIDTSDLENYPVINRWQLVSGLAQWVLLDNTDQVTENGVVFADARWAPNSGVDPVNDAIPTIVSLLSSNYIDLDAPSYSLYPRGTLLFNTRRSGYNVKQFRTNYFTQTNYPNASSYISPTTTPGSLPEFSYTWVTTSGNMTNGAPYMGRKAQRAMVVSAMKAAIDTNQSVREEDTYFNLIATPNYPELQPNMVTLNNDRGQTGYIVGDTPMRLADDANAISAWATNAAGATSTGEDGLVTRDTYMGLYYPSCIGSDLTGAAVALPPSYMLLRTILRNDTIAYPWFAPAGQRRGVVDNATNIGYIDAATGEFVVTKNRLALRNIEYTNFINPVAFFTNIGLLNFGNKNSFDSQSSLDRTNVARLICYLRERLQQAVRPFIFEPNDVITRSQAKAVVQTLLADVQSKRGLYDYLVVCDESNNTPARIDANQLWIDIAIEPVKAVEFIYIPVRILNTGEIAAGV
jgi:hypothetical protein